MIWLIGYKGMLGSEINDLLTDSNLKFICTDIDVDITNTESLQDFVKDKDIKWIINCSAYTAVDKAEDEKEKAYLIKKRYILH